VTTTRQLRAIGVLLPLDYLIGALQAGLRTLPCPPAELSATQQILEAIHDGRLALYRVRR